MTATAGPYLAACLLLVTAGLAKVRRPAATRRAMAAVFGRAGAAVPLAAVRAAGVVEAILGVSAVMAAGARPATAVAFCYLGFAAFVMAAIRRNEGTAGCGCFGAAGDGVPLGTLHLVVNLAAAGAAATVAAAGGLSPASGPERALVTLLSAGLAWAVYLLLIPLPELTAATREARR